MLNRLSATSLFALAVVLAAPALAQHAETAAPAPAPAPAPGPAANSRTTAYDAAFFRAAAPRNALDIARRVPGFAVDLGDTETRGFGGTAGNVVINGARPSSKSESLETTLARIPANRVLRVEVGPGDLYGSDYAGKSQVLNFILTAASGLDGNVTVSARRLFTGDIVPNISASALLKRGASSFSLSAGTGRNDSIENGRDEITAPPGGPRVETREKINNMRPRSPYVSGSWAMENAADRSIRLNARYAPGNTLLSQRNHVIPAVGPERDDTLIQKFKNRVFELGGDITRPLAGGAVKLVGLATRRKRNDMDAYVFDDPARGGFIQTVRSDGGETLARLNWTRADLAGFSFEVGAEGAYNSLDSNVAYFLTNSSGGRTQIALPLDDATVTESRAETFVNLGRSLSPALRVDAGLRYEMSKLKVRGDATAQRSLSFLKPSLTLDWKPGNQWHTQLSILRTVAQLDFNDFLSSAEIANERVNGGNANLLPQRAWEVRATIDRPLLGTGLIKLELGYDRISLLQDRILTDAGFDAPGNIGTGTRSFAKTTIDAPLDRLGIKGGRLKMSGELQRTRVVDAVTGEPRNFSMHFPDWTWSVEYRQDLGNFGYGFNISRNAGFAFYRTKEIDAFENNRPYGSAFVEYRPSARTTITFDIDNMFDTQINRRRSFFTPNRTSPLPGSQEIRLRNKHVIFGLTLKQAFGGSGG